MGMRRSTGVPRCSFSEEGYLLNHELHAAPKLDRAKGGRF